MIMDYLKIINKEKEKETGKDKYKQRKSCVSYISASSYGKENSTLNESNYNSKKDSKRNSLNVSREISLKNKSKNSMELPIVQIANEDEEYVINVEKVPNKEMEKINDSLNFNRIINFNKSNKSLIKEDEIKENENEKIEFNNFQILINNKEETQNMLADTLIHAEFPLPLYICMDKKKEYYFDEKYYNYKEGKEKNSNLQKAHYSPNQLRRENPLEKENVSYIKEVSQIQKSNFLVLAKETKRRYSVNLDLDEIKEIDSVVEDKNKIKRLLKKKK